MKRSCIGVGRFFDRELTIKPTQFPCEILGKVVTSAGFTEVMYAMALKDTEQLPLLEEGAVCESYYACGEDAECWRDGSRASEGRGRGRER